MDQKHHRVIIGQTKTKVKKGASPTSSKFTLDLRLSVHLTGVKDWVNGRTIGRLTAGRTRTPKVHTETHRDHQREENVHRRYTRDHYGTTTGLPRELQETGNSATEYFADYKIFCT